ncbi:hypothetical protein M0R45_016818 [Rubus argutus]|uniref:F-box domain-containing protein n=1 Tax=Rubus argutus TaxID=59490 RepID=A0AAW1XUD2_RUBAR
MADYFPEHVIVRILGRLPIKSLIRFTCVSKRWRFIILSDLPFAKSQILKSRRLLLSAAAGESEFESLDSETVARSASAAAHSSNPTMSSAYSPPAMVWNSSNGDMIDYEESLLWFGDHNNRTCPIELAEKARDASEARGENDGEQSRVDVNVDKQGPNTVNVCVQNQGSSSVAV